jgi:hypothetical protein
MSRYVCERCKTEYHVVGGFIDGTQETEHLCKDLKKRWERREQQRDAVYEVLRDNLGKPLLETSEIVVMTLVNLQINVED